MRCASRCIGRAIRSQGGEGRALLIEAGHYALALALGLSVLQCAVPSWGLLTGDRVLMGVAAPTALAAFASIGLAFAALRSLMVPAGGSEPRSQ